jgi:hypothetical protein
MPRNFNLSGIGLGIYLLGLGIGYIIQQNSGFNILSFWLRLYPVLAILLGLDYILANTGRTARVFAKPNGFVAAIIVLIIAVGLISSYISRFVPEDIHKFWYFDGFHQRRYNWHSSEFITTHDFKLPQGVTTVKLNNAFGDIRVETATGGSITAEARIKPNFPPKRDSNFRQAFQFTSEVQGSTLLITLQKPERLAEKRHININITMAIPKGLSVAVKNTAGNVEVDSIDGNLDVEMAAGNLEVQNVSRDLRVRNKFGTVTIGAVSGNASIVNHSGRVQAGRIIGNSHIESAFGEVILEECLGPVSARLKTGNLNLKLAQISGNSDIDIKMGNIELGLPAQARFTLDGECRMGEISTDFDVAVNRKIASVTANGAINGGGPLIQIKGKSGNIRVYKL